MTTTGAFFLLRRHHKVLLCYILFIDDSEKNVDCVTKNILKYIFIIGNEKMIVNHAMCMVLDFWIINFQ